jgi:hypothetical protein
MGLKLSNYWKDAEILHSEIFPLRSQKLVLIMEEWTGLVLILLQIRTGSILVSIVNGMVHWYP